MSDWEHDPTTGDGEDPAPARPPDPPRPWWATDAGADPTVPPDFTPPVRPAERTQPVPATPDSCPAQPPAWPPPAPPTWPPIPPPPGPAGGGWEPGRGTPEPDPTHPAQWSVGKRVAAAIAAVALILASAGIGAL